MNVDDGRRYTTPDEIAAAEARGERLAIVSDRVAQAVALGLAEMNRHERRKAAAAERRNRRRKQKQ